METVPLAEVVKACAHRLRRNRSDWPGNEALDIADRLDMVAEELAKPPEKAADPENPHRDAALALLAGARSLQELAVDFSSRASRIVALALEDE